MSKKLCVLDVDETIIEWEYASHGSTLCPRIGVYELLDYLKDANIDVALFSTASIRYVRKIKTMFFSDYEFISLRGSESVTFLNGEKIKDISFYTHMGYDIDNIVLVDDKPRNARLFPDNFVLVKTPGYYSSLNRFDSELLKVIKKLDIFFDNKKRLSEESL